jgi:peptidyl-dipeptidase Dcp
MERTGQELDRVSTYMRIWSSNLSSPEFREIQMEMAPRLAEFNTQIIQNELLFDRIAWVYESDEAKDLRPDQKRLLQLVYDRFARNGATLAGAAKARYAEINQRLAQLHTQFGNNVLADEEGYVTYLRANQLGGLPESFVAAAAAAATERGRAGRYAVTNTRSSMDPFLTFSDERDLRERVWRTYYSRGDNGDENDNNAVIAEILALRDERVKLLGYENYAAWRLENRMAKTPEQAFDLLEAVWQAALARVEEEVADMQAIADAEGDRITIAPWDYRYYAEKVRRAKYDLDSDEVKQYLQLDNLIEAMHFVAGELFNFEFTPVPEGSVPVFHEDVNVWEVKDRRSGDHVGVWYLDPFARPGKRSGAWATSYRSYETFDGKKTPLGSNNSNFIKGAPGEAVLISWSDAETLFHEFGHALHYLSSKVAYPTLNGGVRDYTEFQSQLLERWLLTDKVIDNYLLHVETGEPIPDELVQKIKNAATFNQGFETTEYLASALLDMMYHTMDPAGLDPDAFERDALAQLNMPEEIVMRHRSPHFGHIFSGEGYSAGYYSYIWADVLTADAAEAFAEAPRGFYDQDLAARMVEHLFSVRNAVDPADAYRTFRGRDATIDALMRDRGFPVPESAADQHRSAQ